MSVISESKRSQSSIALSTISRLASFTTIGEEQKFSQWRETFFFPLFTEMSRFVHLPRFIYIIQIFVLFVQELGVTMWAGSLLIAKDKNTLLDIIYCLTDWNITRTKNFQDCVPQFATGIVLFFITNLFLIFVSIYYQNKRFFLGSHLVILKILLYPLLNILLPFYASMIARSFVEIANGNTNITSISCFVVAIPIFFISMIELKYTNQFATETPVLDRSLLGSWDDQVLFLTILSISLGSLLSSILDKFPKWLHVAAIIGYCAILVDRIYLLYFFPMLRYHVNSLLMGICIMASANLILSIIHVFTKSLPDYIFFVIGLFSFICGLVWAAYWFNKRKTVRLEALSYGKIIKPESNVDNQKREHFDNLIFSSARDAISYMHVGVAFQAELLIDISFLKYLMENYAEPYIIFAVAKVASFYPAELQFLSYCLSIVSKLSDLSIAQSFLLYQIRRIHVVRQSSVSADASSQLGVLQKMSRETISQVRGFWGEILNAKTEISFASLHYLRRVTLKTDSAFLDACDRFPNNVSIMNEYCRFQIEAMGDYSGAISSGKKMLLLDQGKNLTVDHAFRSLVNIYPNYLLNNIMNVHGNLIKKGLLSDSSSASISSNSNSSNEEFEERYEELIAQLYTHGKLRIALQTRMKSTKLKAITSSMTYSIIQLLSCVLLFLVIVFVLPLSSENALKMIECCNEISKMTLSIQYISCIAAVQTAIQGRTFGGVTILKQLLGIKNSQLNQNPSLMNKPYDAVQATTDILKERFESSNRVVMSIMKSYIDNIPIFSDENTEYKSDIYNSLNMTLRSSITFFSYAAESVASLSRESESRNELINKMKELMLNVNSITESLQLFQKSIGDLGDDEIINQKDTIQIVSIIIVAAGFSVFLFIRIYNNVMIFKQAKNCSDLLRKTNPNLIKESYLPIALKGQKEAICGNNVHSAHELNIMMIIYPVIIIISILLTAAFVVLAILYFLEGLDITSHVFGWFVYGTARFSTIFQSLVILCSKTVKLISYNEVDDLLFKFIEDLKNSQKEIDVTLMGIDPRFNLFYYTKECNIVSDGSSQFSENFADYVSCLSLDNKINIAFSSISILAEQNITTNLNDQNFASLVFLIDMYFAEELEDFQDILVDYAKEHFHVASYKTASLCISGLIISCLVFLLEQFFIRTFLQCADAIKQLIAVLPPVSVATSTVLMDFLNNGTKTDNIETSMSASESILSATTTAAVLLDKKHVIQAVNKAVNTTTGFTPDQILGQMINWLVPIPSNDHNNDADADIAINEKFYTVLEDMLNNNANVDNFRNSNNNNINNYNNNNNINKNNNGFLEVKSDEEHFEDEDLIFFGEDDDEINVQNGEQTLSNNGNLVVMTTKCLTENGSIIPAKTTVLFLRDETKGNDQFVLLLRDLSKELESKKVIMEAKARANKLLAALIPKDVIDRSLEFTADCATVIFIEVSGLTEYVHTLSPQQLMSNLKTVYDGFERIANDFPAISILKTNSELFVACCGLFNSIGDIKEQANQAVLYSNRMIEEIEAINEELDIDLHLRIGINVGGPIVGRMLNPKTPTFEILGQFIGLAAKMQTEGEIGVVQVGGSVLQYLNKEKFEIDNGIGFPGTFGSVEQTFTVRPIVV